MGLFRKQPAFVPKLLYEAERSGRVVFGDVFEDVVQVLPGQGGEDQAADASRRPTCRARFSALSWRRWKTCSPGSPSPRSSCSTPALTSRRRRSRLLSNSNASSRTWPWVRYSPFATIWRMYSSFSGEISRCIVLLPAETLRCLALQLSGPDRLSQPTANGRFRRVRRPDRERGDDPHPLPHGRVPAITTRFISARRRMSGGMRRRASSISSAVVVRERLKRTDPWASLGSTFMAFSTCEASSEPL